jgi:hypothetical protein
MIPCTPLAADRRGLRTTPCLHPMEHRTRPCGCPLLACIPLCPATASTSPFASGKGMRRLARHGGTCRPLPGPPPSALNRQYVLSALGRGGACHGTHHGILAGRHDARGSRCMSRKGGSDRSLVTEAGSDEESDGTIDLRPQCQHGRGVWRGACRHRGGDQATLGIHTQRQFLPAPGRLLAVFLALPGARAPDL